MTVAIECFYPNDPPFFQMQVADLVMFVLDLARGSEGAIGEVRVRVKSVV